MHDTSDATLHIPYRPAPCLACGYYVAPGTVCCPRCGALIEVEPDPSVTTARVRRPATISETTTPSEFPADARVVLQFLPSAHCMSLDLPHPIVLGRSGLPGSDGLIDLTDYDARQHGVSRRHCILERRDPYLVVIDLGSTNGTYLNGDRLAPQQAVPVSSGDRLILGTLHMMITFHERASHQ